MSIRLKCSCNISCPVHCNKTLSFSRRFSKISRRCLQSSIGQEKTLMASVVLEADRQIHYPRHPLGMGTICTLIDRIITLKCLHDWPREVAHHLLLHQSQKLKRNRHSHRGSMNPRQRSNQKTCLVRFERSRSVCSTKTADSTFPKIPLV